MKKLKIIISVVLAIALVGAGVAFFPRSDKSAAAVPAGQIVDVTSGTVQVTVSASGSVTLPRQSKLTFGSSGPVAAVNVRTGDRVQKGQVLAKLDTSDLERSLARAEDDLRLAKERQRIGYSSADLARAEASVNTAQANLAATQSNLDSLVLQRSSTQASVDTAKANLANAQSALDTAILQRSSAHAAVDNAAANLAKAQADLSLTDVERATAQAAVDQAQQNSDNTQTGSTIDFMVAQNNLQKATDTYNNAMKQKLSDTQTNDAWYTWQRAQLQYLMDQQAITNRITDAQNTLAKAKDNLARLMPGGSTAQQREVAVTSAKAALASAQDDLSRLIPGGATIQQREAAVTAAKAALASAQDDLSKLMPSGVTIKQAEAAVATAKAALSKAQEDLISMKVGASSAYDQLAQQVSITKLESQVADAKDSLSKATVTAPYDGVVNDVNIKVGDTASGSAVAIVFIDNNVKEVQTTVDEVDVAQLRMGQQANITFDALTGLTIPGRVVALAPDAKVTSGVVSYAVTIALMAPNTGTSTAQPGGAPAASGTTSQGGATPGAGGTPTPGGTARQGGATSGAGGTATPGGTTRQGGATSGTGGTATPGGMARQGGATSGAGAASGGRVRFQGTAAGYDALIGGMTALAQIIVQEKNDVVLVPNKAIKTSGQNRTVQVVLPSGLTETRKVTVGITDGVNTEIVDGLTEGEKVLIPAATARSTSTTSSQPGQQIRIPGVPGLGR